MLDRRANRRKLCDRQARPQHPTQSTEGQPPALLPEVRVLPIASIRTDGDTQHRMTPDPNVVQEYAELMRSGVAFPPVDVRWDGKDYWLSDGFQRIDAAKLADLTGIRAAIRPGTREDAQWDSFAANATHGLRRTPAETKRVIQLALQHANAKRQSNVQIAKHLHIPESTVRYWRKQPSSQSCEDGIRIVTRGDATYELNASNIGKNRNCQGSMTRRNWRVDLAAMKEHSSAVTRPLLLIIEHWLRGLADSARCLDAIERFVQGPHTSKRGCGGEE